MPRLVNLTNLKLHSPSSQIVGTPFANDDTRFEYPFPDVTPSDTVASTSTLTLTPTTSRSPPNPSSTIVLMTQPKITTTLNHPANSRLRLKITTNPPIPPTLAAKKAATAAAAHMRKFSLGASGQRRSSSGQSNTSVSTSTTDGSNRSPPTPLSPTRKSRR